MSYLVTGRLADALGLTACTVYLPTEASLSTPGLHGLAPDAWFCAGSIAWALTSGNPSLLLLLLPEFLRPFSAAGAATWALELLRLLHGNMLAQAVFAMQAVAVM